MIVTLNQDQYYISVDGRTLCGKKGETIDADESFLSLIEGKFEEAKEEKAPSEKPINKMNKDELIEKLRANGIDISDEEAEGQTKAQLIELING